jgi:hypothetical protein
VGNSAKEREGEKGDAGEGKMWCARGICCSTRGPVGFTCDEEPAHKMHYIALPTSAYTYLTLQID